MEIVLAAARSKQIEIDLHAFSNLTDYSTFALKLTNFSTRNINGENTILVEIMMHRREYFLFTISEFSGPDCESNSSTI